MPRGLSRNTLVTKDSYPLPEIQPIPHCHIRKTAHFVNDKKSILPPPRAPPPPNHQSPTPSLYPPLYDMGVSVTFCGNWDRQEGCGVWSEPTKRINAPAAPLSDLPEGAQGPQFPPPLSQLYTTRVNPGALGFTESREPSELHGIVVRLKWERRGVRSLRTHLNAFPLRSWLRNSVGAEGTEHNSFNHLRRIATPQNPPQWNSSDVELRSFAMQTSTQGTVCSGRERLKTRPDENTACSARLPSHVHIHPLQFVVCYQPLGGKKIALRGGGGMARKPICPTPFSPSLVAVPGGGFGLALPYLPCRGGGGPTPTCMAQNDPHVALIILTTHMWGKIFS